MVLAVTVRSMTGPLVDWPVSVAVQRVVLWGAPSKMVGVHAELDVTRMEGVQPDPKLPSGELEDSPHGIHLLP